jgi:hypothetical protein
LEQVFNCCTKEKARCGRDYQLLILDGHGSYVTEDFKDYCDLHQILLAVMPPHSTHTLQPLNVVMFKPLSGAYSKELTNHLHQSQGLIPIKKGDFFPLFYRAWEVSFRKELITKSFKATSIWPIDLEVVLKRFTTPTHTDDEDSLDEDTNDWQHLERLLRSAVDDLSSDSSKKLSLKLHHLQVENELVTGENEGLREALKTKKKHKKHGKALNLQQRQEYWGSRQFWSPRSLRESRHRNAITQRLNDEDKLQKAETKKLKAAAALYNKKIAEEKRVAREEAKVVRDREKAEKAAAAAAKKAAQNTKKSLLTAQSGNRKALRASSPKPKRQRRAGGAAAFAASPEAAPAAPPKLNSRGRPINVPAKYR